MVTSSMPASTRRLSAVVLATGGGPRVAGLTLAERAAAAARRVHAQPVRVVAEGVAANDPIEDDECVMVLAPDVLVESKALNVLARAAVDAGCDVPIVAEDNRGPLVAVVSAPLAREVLAEGSLSSVVVRHARAGTAARPLSAEHYCRRVEPGTDLRALGREYARHLNGRESYFTKKIRRFSVPVSVWLAERGASPTAVTLAGLAFAVASALCIAQGAYLWGLLGAALYYWSMVLDCSDGEVARLRFTDSAFGAWLETAVDYLTYVLLLVSFAVRGPGAGGSERFFRGALFLALAGSVVVIVVASYLRQRVAGQDPGEFDAASAQVMKQSSRFHRFARWGRQWIKRSTIAHLLVALAVVGQLPVLIYLWAFGASVAAVVIVAVEPFVVRRVRVQPMGLTRG